MHIETFVFALIIQFLPQRQFRRILARYNDRTQGWAMSHWNHSLVLMFGQLIGCGSLRELTDITIAHGKNSKHLGFATSLSIDRCCPRPMPSETIISLRSSLSTWWLLPNPNASRRSSSCMEGSMPLTLRLLTSACPYSDGQSSEARSRASGSILRLTSSRRFSRRKSSRMIDSSILTLIPINID